jgi:hypothetical protein
MIAEGSPNSPANRHHASTRRTATPLLVVTFAQGSPVRMFEHLGQPLDGRKEETRHPTDRPPSFADIHIRRRAFETPVAIRSRTVSAEEWSFLAIRSVFTPRNSARQSTWAVPFASRKDSFRKRAISGSLTTNAKSQAKNY